MKNSFGDTLLLGKPVQDCPDSCQETRECRGIICLLCNILFNSKKVERANHLVSVLWCPETCVSMGLDDSL